MLAIEKRILLRGGGVLFRLVDAQNLCFSLASVFCPFLTRTLAAFFDARRCVLRRGGGEGVDS